MGALEDRVAIITGAGRGLGREHALLFAREGAKVVVNDLGGDVHGAGADRAAAQLVVDEIRDLGGEAVANTDSVADWDGAKRLVDLAVETFGDLHVLVNNAGITRHQVITAMTEREWDDVVAVHLKGHFCTTRHAAAYWRDQSQSGRSGDRSIIHTSSGVGLFANPGHANYAAAKSAIATLSQIAAKELASSGVRSNTIAPSARTRMTLAEPDTEEKLAPPTDQTFDSWDPANVSPLVAYLASADCPFSGETFHVGGGHIQRVGSWSAAGALVKDSRWTIEELLVRGPELAGPPADLPLWYVRHEALYQTSQGN